MFERDRGRRVTGDDGETRMETFDQAAEQSWDAARNLGFASLAVGKAGAVGGVDDGRVRQEFSRGAEHRQSPDTRIEEQDGGIRVHRGSVACQVSSRKLRCRSGLLLNPPMTRELLLAAALGYLLGSIPFGLVLTLLAGKGDIRKIGSGNIGATNVLRTGSKFLAVLTMILDCLKATAAIVLAQRLIGAETGAAAGAGAFVGHLYPVWLRFRGGKGVATLLGVLIALLWPAALVYAAVWLFLVLTLRISSLAGMTAAIAAPIVA